MNSSNTNISNISNNIETNVTLHFLACYFFTFDIKYNATNISRPEITCMPKGSYLTGKETGPVVCTLIFAVIYSVGVFGFFANIFNIIVLRKTHQIRKRVSLKYLVISLAAFDLIACFISIIYPTLIIIIKGIVYHKEFKYTLCICLNII